MDTVYFNFSSTKLTFLITNNKIYPQERCFIENQF
jgi:hypothetical protein